jgi:hypothetical protein
MRFTAAASCHVKAPERVVYSVLTGYREYQSWVPDVVRSRLFAREGEIAIAEFISPPYGGEKLLLEFVESPRASIVFTQVDRFRRDGIFGRFDLESAHEGEGVVVKGRLGLRGGIRRLGCRRRLRHVLDRTLEALTDRALKLLASGLSEMPRQRVKLLEIETGRERATLRVGLRTYELRRVAEEERE